MDYIVERRYCRLSVPFVFSIITNHCIFLLQYKKFVKDITSLMTWEVKNNFALMGQLAASITSAARLSNSSFPYLTNPEFEISGGYLDGLSGMISVIFAPFVSAENQTSWEEYSVSKQGWIAEGAHLREVHPDHKAPLKGSFQDHESDRRLNSVFGVSYYDAMEDVLSGALPYSEEAFGAVGSRISQHVYTMLEGKLVPYQGLPDEILAPVWQIAPTPNDDPKMVNFNLLADPIVSELHDNIKIERETVISRSFEVQNLFDHAFDANEKEQKKLPHSYIAEPVFESMEPNAKQVGILLSLVAWNNFFSNILPDHAQS